jgi:uncharacterized protein (TIGR02996 family)
MSNDVSNLLTRICKLPGEEVFIKALFENRCDDGFWDAYADWLKQHGDPRGDYLRLREAREIAFEKNISLCESLRLQMKEMEGRLDPLWLACLGCSITAKVTRATDEAIYVDLGGIEGEIHIRDMSW